MPKLMHFKWVKNVNNLFMVGWVKGVLLSPVIINSVWLVGWFIGKLSLNHNYIPQQSTQLSTLFFIFLNLLNSFYTHNPQALLLRQQKNI
jgi:hypothetical protein